MTNQTTTHRIIRLPEVISKTGLSRSTIYLRVSRNGFPKPVNLGGRAVGWVEAEIQEWLNLQIESSRKILGEEGGQSR